MIVSSSDPAIPFACSCVCWKWIRYQKGIFNHWGNDVVFWIYCRSKGVAKFKSSYNSNYMKMISLQHVMEKIINE